MCFASSLAPGFQNGLAAPSFLPSLLFHLRLINAHLTLRVQIPLAFVRAPPDTREKASLSLLPTGPGDPVTEEDKALLHAEMVNSGPFRKSVRDKARKDHEFSGQR